MIPKRLELPRAVAAMNESIRKGCETHPGEQEPWPPPNIDSNDLYLAISHLLTYNGGETHDAEGFSHLANAMTRIAFVIERQKIEEESDG